MTDHKEPLTPFTIVSQGAPRVSTVRILDQSDRLLLLNIDMSSKRDHAVIHINGQQIAIFAGPGTDRLAEGVHRDAPTIIEVTGIPRGFGLFMADSARYSVMALFRAGDNNGEENG